MKKAVSISSCALFTFIVFLPFAVMLFSYFGYVFNLTSYPLFAVLTALIAIITVVLSIIAKEFIQNTSVPVLLVLISPLSLINSVFYLIECGTVLVAASMFICFCCCCCLTIRHGKPVALKITGLVLSALMIIPICTFGFMALVFGDFGENTVVQKIESPNGVYFAEVIDSDQGALGGDTLVDVYENKEINALVFKISKKRQRIYRGEWGEFENMTVYWKNENCLVIDSVEYIIE